MKMIKYRDGSSGDRESRCDQNQTNESCASERTSHVTYVRNIQYVPGYSWQYNSIETKSSLITTTTTTTLEHGQTHTVQRTRRDP